MSVVSYIAKRDIERTAFAAAGADISVDGTDDSFNAVSTDLSGLLDNEWIKVAGFGNAANNGWFQANSASTATKILQDTSADLVTEAAGPNVSILGYKRGFGQVYSIEFSTRGLKRSRSFTLNRSEALGGARETLLHRIEYFWDIVTGRLLQADLPQWAEFLASVAAGEVFTFDPYGTIASPDNPRNCELDLTTYSEDRIGVGMRYTIPLRFLEV